jgi:hypothetical protein
MTSSVGAAAVVLLLSSACTDLTEVPSSSITPENFYRNETEAIGGLASVYAQMRCCDGGIGSYYGVSEVTTDEIIVPTRGTDWYDNGKWLDLHRHTWTANSPGTLDNINNAWLGSFNGVARANVVLAALEHVDFATKPVIVAELRALRAWYYYTLMDMFGGVPIVTTTEIKPRERNTRAEVFKFIEDELIAARPDLPDKWPAAMNGRITKGVADAILASIYLNAEVFTGTVTEAGLQKGAARWQDAVTVSDRILNSGVYTLAADWRSNFRADNGNSPENIFVIKYLNQPDLGLVFAMSILHYNQYSGGSAPWNGFSTLAETYNAFDPADQRRQIFLIGMQVNQVTGLPVTDRAGNPLFFDPNIINDAQAAENIGARILKWPVDPNHLDQNNGNDYTHFRLAEIYLIKAEALNELGGNTAGALALVNTVRARVAPLLTGPYTQAEFRQVILNERLFELTAESKRRQDLIRMGQFNTRPWAFKSPASLTQAYRVLMPIPQTQLSTNPLLVQNAGY